MESSVAYVHGSSNAAGLGLGVLPSALSVAAEAAASDHNDSHAHAPCSHLSLLPGLMHVQV
jgi:hypothetical protein